MQEKSTYDDETSLKEKKLRENSMLISMRLAVARKMAGDLTISK